jgi:putative FmdB family regulatory protein
MIGSPVAIAQRIRVPTYSYRCTECDNSFDIQQAFTDDSLTICPVCGGKLRKVFNNIAVTFNGSGFYRTDSRAKPEGAAGSSSESASGSGSDSSGSKESAGSSSAGSSAADSSGSAPKSDSPSTKTPAKTHAESGSTGRSGNSLAGKSGSAKSGPGKSGNKPN